MKKTILAVLVAATLGEITMAKEIKATNLNEKNEFVQPFELGELNPYGKFFTGTTYLNTLDDGSSGRKVSIANVTFEPCSRTDWHTHSKGQALVITAGSGIYKSWGKRARIIEPGDIVKINPDEKHFHAGGATTWMAHLSIMDANDNKTVWLEKVSDEEFKNAVAEAIKQPNK
ncbi:Cupin domain-containing protein [Campylobacter iguaniorum]|uniref:cupin domain-containing protein n=1 Tax=Campylobacter iguaniorum TaxID=1244531 RepID=UPI00073AC208|nr:cupin domain-containing protein [Campylobacter iguaniorum]ALV25409.1 Cupin domain-containing protein [Campylobacter iguaniorum]